MSKIKKAEADKPARPAFVTDDNAKFPTVYYEEKTGYFWMQHSDGSFQPLKERDIKRQAMLDGFNCEEWTSCGMKAGDMAFARAQRCNRIACAIPLAGRDAGIFEFAGKRILVPETCRPVAPKKGRWDFIMRLHEELFDNAEQLAVMLSWLKLSHESLSSRAFHPGQMPCLVGKPNCGKSLWQWLVTQLFGGRSANPYMFMSGKVNFNAELAEAEHLCIGDEETSFDIRARRAFGSWIKKFTVEEDMHINGKGLKAVMLPFWRRLTCTLNSENEEIYVLPPMVEGIADKIILILCGMATFERKRTEIAAAIIAELPAFVHFLQGYKIPDWLHEPEGRRRFGMRAYHHPDLLDLLAATSPETRLRDLLDEIIFIDRKNGKVNPDEILFEGTSETLERDLLSSPFNWQVQRLLSHASACGTYMSRLCTQFPDRFSSCLRGGKRVWKIKPPKTEKE